MAFNSTTGLGVAAKILTTGNDPAYPIGSTIPGKNTILLSLSGNTYPTTFQLNPQIVDVAGTAVDTGSALTLTSVAASTVGVLTLTSVAASTDGVHSVYTGTITGGGSNALAGQVFTVAGFVTNPTNNGSFIATASSTTTLTLANPDAIAETHAATATSEEGGTNQLTYVVYPSKTLTGNTYQPSGTSTAVATVSATGLLTAVALGSTEVEVSFPTFNNSEGTTGAPSGNPMHGLPLDKIYSSVKVKVLL